METHAQLNFQTLFASIPGLYVVYSPEFTVVDGSDDYFRAITADKETILGCDVFETLEKGCDRIPTQALKASLEQVLATGKSHTLHYTTGQLPPQLLTERSEARTQPDTQQATQQNHVEPVPLGERSSAASGNDRLSWLSVHSPIFDDSGNLTHILRKIEDLTASTQAIQQPLQRTLDSTTQQLETLLSGTNDLFYSLNSAWQFTYVNDRLCEIVDRGREQILGDRIWDLFPDDAITDLRIHFQKTLEAQNPSRIEYFYDCWNRWYDHQLYPSPEGLTVVATDITARKRTDLLLAEQNKLLALIASEQSMEACLERVCASISQLSRRTRASILIANEQAQLFVESITPGFSASLGQVFKNIAIGESTIGTCHSAVHHSRPIACTDIEHDANWAQKWKETCLDNNVLACYSMPIIGEQGQAYGSLMLCFDEARSPTLWEVQLAEFGAKYAAIAFDRDRTTRALRQEETKYRTLFESMDEGFCLCEMLFDEQGDPFDYRFLEANPMFKTLTGIRYEQGKTMREIVPDLESYWYEAFGQVVRTGKPVRFEQRAAALNSWFDVNAFPTGEPDCNRFAILFTNITGRKHVEQALQYSEQQSRSILASISDGFLALDDNWCYTYLNKQAEKLLGRSAADLLGKNMWEEYPGTVGSAFEAAYRKTAREKVATSVTDFYHDHNRWYEVHAYPAQTGITVYFQDVTHTKQAEIDLQETIQQLSAIYDGSRRFVGLITPDGCLVKTNRASLEFAHSQLEDVVGKPYWDTVWFQHTPGAPEQVRQAVQRAFEGESIRYDAPIVTPTGEVKTYELSFYPIRNEAGDVTFVMPEATDITARISAQAALRDSEERFRALADNIAQFAWIADASGYIFWYNQRWLDYTGLTLDESVKGGWHQVHHTDYVESTTKKFNLHIQQGDPWEDTFPLRDKAGNYRWFLSRAVPIYDEHNKVSRWFGTHTDITERLEAEKEKEQLLEREQQARIAAESANRTKDEFLAVVSHELRTPLNSILGWSQILQKKKLTPKLTNQALGTIEHNAKAQAQLVDDLLDVSRILQGKLRLKVGSVNLANAIQAAIDTVELSAAAKSITLHTALDADVSMLSGDADRLQQIVWNLLSNAIKFTPRGGRIEVALRQAGETAQITISDTGQGIHAEFLPLVFEHFRQQDASITRRFGGLGLGLAIVKDLVELHGGTISVESEGEGKGSTFTILLPLR